jgi:ubiquinone/menaquinone biosynthesis C-methylase UbiE
LGAGLEPSMSFKDFFSGHAVEYDAYRPTYPQALFKQLAALAPGHERAWDCATGNGQAAQGLAPYFRTVIATDASAKQLGRATPHAGISYLVGTAEHAPLEDRSVDLVTVAQALHWLRLPEFYAEVRRVARPGAAFAAWCYGLSTFNPAIDAVIYRLYEDILGTYWAPERRHVEAGYTTLEFPFEPLAISPVQMTAEWDLHHLVGYLGTWSSAQAYQKKHGADPIELIQAELEEAWGDPRGTRTATWPLSVRVGRVSVVSGQ